MRLARVCLGVLSLLSACATPDAPQQAVELQPVTTGTLSGVVGAAVVPVPAVRAVDHDGRSVAGVSVVFTATASGEVTGASVRTGSDGIASAASWKLGPKSGPQLLTASAQNLRSVTFGAIARPDAPASITCVSGCSQTAPSGATLLAPVSLRLSDRFNNPVANAPVNFVVTEGGGTVMPVAQNTNVIGGVAGWWTLGSENVNSFRASADGITLTMSVTAQARPVPVTGDTYQLSAIDGAPMVSTDRIVLGKDGRFVATLGADGGTLFGNGVFSREDSSVVFVYSDGFLGAFQAVTGQYSETGASSRREAARLKGTQLEIVRCMGDDCYPSLRWTYRLIAPASP